MGSTILFIHPKTDPTTRTYSTYKSDSDCLAAICGIYEEHLKRRLPDVDTITYDVMQLFDFLDSFVDISCLVYQQSTHSYAPYGREWIKDRIFDEFRKNAQK